MITTDPLALVVKLLLRNGGDPPLLRWWSRVKGDCDWYSKGDTCEGVVGECSYRERAEYVQNNEPLLGRQRGML